jgi:hypothetical protein
MEEMDTQVKLSEQETKVVDYLVIRNNGGVYWEELAQFAKDPKTVKMKTVQKTVSEIKRKYVTAGVPVPFDVKFKSIPPVEEVKVEEKPVQTIGDLNQGKIGPSLNLSQNLVQIKKTPAGNTIVVDGKNNTTTLAAHVDFVLDRNTKRVKTKFGSHLLNDSEWEVFKYIHSNAGRIIAISELRDKVVFEHYGSKLPARWYDSIMRIINNMRRAIPGLERRLLTVKGVETSYLFQ